jgi:hypothetical protein
MPVRKRNLSRRGALSTNEAAWLRGDRNCGFVEFKHDDELQALWAGYGDHEAFSWAPGMNFPEPIED